jgi:hypothetical protein
LVSFSSNLRFPKVALFPKAVLADNRGVSASLQETYAPTNRCFGCGPANERGLRIKSRVEGDEVVAEWRPEAHHQAFDGILNGGIAGALLDCHSNWTAAYHLMRKAGADEPPCTVTAEFHVTLKRPTPMDVPLRAHTSSSPPRTARSSRPRSRRTGR